MGQCNSLVAGGNETTATTLAFAIYLLAQHPEVEAKLVAESNSLPSDRSVIAAIAHSYQSNDVGDLQ